VALASLPGFLGGVQTYHIYVSRRAWPILGFDLGFISAVTGKARLFHAASPPGETAGGSFSGRRRSGGAVLSRVDDARRPQHSGP